MSEVALITVSCVLFIQMGLAGAILDFIELGRIRPCPKCLTFWCNALWMGFHGYDFLLLVATSFIASYCALWLTLAYDAMATLYNYIYEQLTKTTDTPKIPKARRKGKARSSDEVS